MWPKQPGGSSTGMMRLHGRRRRPRLLQSARGLPTKRRRQCNRAGPCPRFPSRMACKAPLLRRNRRCIPRRCRRRRRMRLPARMRCTWRPSHHRRRPSRWPRRRRHRRRRQLSRVRPSLRMSMSASMATTTMPRPGAPRAAHAAPARATSARDGRRRLRFRSSSGVAT